LSAIMVSKKALIKKRYAGMRSAAKEGGCVVDILISAG